ncbi:hypothetical protein K435DRAFT_942012 [Dendrothele bispora CBS 962.96]|uniref:Uncharacterized protein n=1 Tax=Dendrothele bispora (strain CBS 962.96) TaxID=1314807 RepID=A0A4S8KV99_DENBC|nr:hypothetical protein K435DRAFT_942012 [Dendrothele bispora CBS 962.96]
MNQPFQQFRLKFATAAVVSVISISTAFIWIPAQLQINHRFMALNHWWDKFEKCVYLNLIVHVARSTGVNVYQDKTITAAGIDPSKAFQLTTVHVQTQVYTHHHEDETTSAENDPSSTGKKIREDELTRTAVLTTVRRQSIESSYAGDTSV